MKIFVGGAGSGSGKTTFVRLILKIFPNKFTAVKISVSDKFPCGTVREKLVLDTPGKDTGYFLNGGAKSVCWIRGSRSCIENEIKKALSELEGNIIVEGNSAVNCATNGILFFVFRNGEEIKKESAIHFKSRANYLVENVENTDEPYLCGNVLRINLIRELNAPSKKTKDILLNILQLA